MIHRKSVDRQPIRSENSANGWYAGEYKRDKTSLIRTSDGLRLVMGDRGQQTDPHTSRFYLIDKTPAKGYLSNLYGTEFDDRTYRYQIVWREDDPEVADIVTLYRLRRAGNGGKKRW